MPGYTSRNAAQNPSAPSAVARRGALAVAVADRHQLLVAVLVGTHDHQDATALLVQPYVYMQPVGPEVHVALGAQVTPRPLLILLSQTAFSRTTLFALSPAACLPRTASSACEKSPLDTRFRYSAGIKLSTLGTRFM